MTTIEIPDELAAALLDRAAAEGMNLDDWLERKVAENVTRAAEEEKTRLEWLRAAAKEGFDAIERGECTELNSPEEIATFVRQIGEEVEAEFEAERRFG
jgi:hypothetical protein